MNRPFPDQLGRPLRDLRISVTDRCNFRCTYCMPKEVFGSGYRFLPPNEMLSFAEITRLAGLFVLLGVRKLRITGGEPLLRHGLPELVRMLAGIDGVEDLTLTTNGSLLPALAAPLRSAGLDRITVSLDSLDEAVFQGMNDARFPVSGVLAGISAALDAGFAPVKINMVVKRGVNEGSIIPMARRFRNSGCIVRFIEYMDVGNANGWRLEEVVPAAEILQILNAEFPLEAMESFGIGEVASRYRYRDGGGEIGIISSVTQPFCRGCTRARISSDGALYTCLFASEGCDLRGLLRSGSDDEEIAERIRDVWSGREDRYSELRRARSVTAPKVEMSRIGG